MTEHIISFSGGKDSTAMLLMMIEKEIPFDEIIFCDTGLEFPAMYGHIRKVEDYIERPITIIHSEKPFEYWFAEHIKVKGKRKGEKGYGWMGPNCRWCTRALKQEPWRKYLVGRPHIRYLGIACDEKHRRFRNRNNQEAYPLIDWKITEAECLQYCKDRGFDWGGLYDIFCRVSCWCCSLQRIGELRNLYTHFPDLWKKLMKWDKKSLRSFRPNYSLERIDKRFREE